MQRNWLGAAVTSSGGANFAQSLVRAARANVTALGGRFRFVCVQAGQLHADSFSKRFGSILPVQLHRPRGSQGTNRRPKQIHNSISIEVIKVSALADALTSGDVLVLQSLVVSSNRNGVYHAEALAGALDPKTCRRLSSTISSATWPSLMFTARHARHCGRLKTSAALHVRCVRSGEQKGPKAVAGAVFARMLSMFSPFTSVPTNPIGDGNTRDQ